jgi:hypothetical protein
MADYQDQFKRILDEEVGDYAARALGLLTQAIQAKRLMLSEELLHSLRTQVVGATTQHVASLGVLFEQYRSRRIKDTKGSGPTRSWQPSSSGWKPGACAATLLVGPPVWLPAGCCQLPWLPPHR